MLGMVISAPSLRRKHDEIGALAPIAEIFTNHYSGVDTRGIATGTARRGPDCAPPKSDVAALL
jgi:hypothetical protein